MTEAETKLTAIDDEPVKYLKLQVNVTSLTPTGHVTFMFFGKEDKVTIQQLREWVKWENLCNMLLDESIKMDGFATNFGDAKNLSVITFKSSIGLELLRDTLYREMPEKFKSINYPKYRPHVTLGPNDQFPAMHCQELLNHMAELKLRKLEVTGVITNDGREVFDFRDFQRLDGTMTKD